MAKPETHIACPRFIEVIELTQLVGLGTEEDPKRTIRVYWSKDEIPLAVFDPCLDPYNLTGLR